MRDARGLRIGDGCGSRIEKLSSVNSTSPAIKSSRSAVGCARHRQPHEFRCLDDDSPAFVAPSCTPLSKLNLLTGLGAFWEIQWYASADLGRWERDKYPRAWDALNRDEIIALGLDCDDFKGLPRADKPVAVARR